MKINIIYAVVGILLVVLVLFALFRQKNNSQKEQNPAPTVTASTFKNEKVGAQVFSESIKTIAEGQLLDIRTTLEFSEAHIAGAKNIDFYQTALFRSELAKLDKEKTYYIYCHSGNRSGQSISIFRDLGFKHVIELNGGLNSWQSANLPLVN